VDEHEQEDEEDAHAGATIYVCGNRADDSGTPTEHPGTVTDHAGTATDDRESLPV
jgi:hypothetical protein